MANEYFEIMMILKNMRTVKSLYPTNLISCTLVKCQISWLVMTKKLIQMEKLEFCDFKLKLKVGHWEQVWFQLLLKRVKKYNWFHNYYWLIGEFEILLVNVTSWKVIITFHLVSFTLLAKVIITFHLVSLLLAKVIITFCLVSFTLWAKVNITFQLVSWTLLAKVIITIHLVVLIRQWPSLSRNQPTFLLVNITIRLVPQGQIHVVC